LHISAKSYFKAITYELKAFKISLNVINRIIKVPYSAYTFCSIRINVTKYDVTFATMGGRGHATEFRGTVLRTLIPHACTAAIVVGFINLLYLE